MSTTLVKWLVRESNLMEPIQGGISLRVDQTDTFVYKADDVARVMRPMLADYIGMMEFLLKQAPGTFERERDDVRVRLAEAQRLLKELEGK